MKRDKGRQSTKCSREETAETLQMPPSRAILRWRASGHFSFDSFCLLLPLIFLRVSLAFFLFPSLSLAVLATLFRASLTLWQTSTEREKRRYWKRNKDKEWTMGFAALLETRRREIDTTDRTKGTTKIKTEEWRLRETKREDRERRCTGTRRAAEKMKETSFATLKKQNKREPKRTGHTAK